MIWSNNKSSVDLFSSRVIYISTVDLLELHVLVLVLHRVH